MSTVGLEELQLTRFGEFFDTIHGPSYEEVLDVHREALEDVYTQAAKRLRRAEEAGLPLEVFDINTDLCEKLINHDFPAPHEVKTAFVRKYVIPTTKYKHHLKLVDHVLNLMVLFHVAAHNEIRQLSKSYAKHVRMSAAYTIEPCDHIIPCHNALCMLDASQATQAPYSKYDEMMDLEKNDFLIERHEGYYEYWCSSLYLYSLLRMFATFNQMCKYTPYPIAHLITEFIQDEYEWDCLCVNSTP